MFVGLPVWPDEEYATRSACDLVREKPLLPEPRAEIRSVSF